MFVLNIPTFQHQHPPRELWQKKKQEEEQLLFRDLEELKELSRAKMFGRLTVELSRATTLT